MNQKWKTMAYSIKRSFHEIVLDKINVFNISNNSFENYIVSKKY